MSRLPPVSISPVGEELIEKFASSREMPVAEALRMLIAESPQLIAFAESQKIEIDFQPMQRGGRRIPKDVQEQLERLQAADNSKD